jgi:GTPase Era involved in 16S rRNA processing
MPWPPPTWCSGSSTRRTGAGRGRSSCFGSSPARRSRPSWRI